MTLCVDCPDVRNGTRKRAVCCRREGAALEKDNRFPPTPGLKQAAARLQIGDVVPLPPRKLDVRPAFTGAGAPSFKAARHGKRAPGK